ncbi:hypothetical protein NIES4101_34140 [Calothrix sp. NIES-4101]|nr:hypothetical protein NIES4101_34140 [Calothrix sp. NIES-4101]
MNNLITNPDDLEYISDIANQVLENRQKLTDIKDLQAALKEVSLEHGREIQINLVFTENLLTGFNFSFVHDPEKTTPTIPFKPQEINIDSNHSDIIPYSQATTKIEIATTNRQGNLTIPSSSPSGIIINPGLQVEDQRIINPNDSETNQIIETPTPRLKKRNPGLINAVSQLANQHEINGLMLTGLGLKTGISVTDTLQTEEKPDIQNTGLAIIKRFQQVLPEEFMTLKAGDYPQSFKWKDPESNKQYHFYFEAAPRNEIGETITTASLKGFEIISGSDIKPVFIANLIDAKYNRWSIEQCDFNQRQIQSLNLACKSTVPHQPKTTVNNITESYLEI